MKDYLLIKKRLLITAVFTLYALSLILWDYFHAGVPVHYLFHSDDFPGISNWWGVLIVPFFSWVVLNRMSRREDQVNESTVKYVTLRFLLGAVFGAIISILFFSEANALVSYLMIALLAVSFFLPLYKAEFLLGYVMSTLFAFGAFIPTLGALILMCLLFLFYRIGRLIVSVFQSRQSI